MLIFFDTNIFYNNWFLGSPNFTLFFNFLENADSTLLTSELIMQELDNLHWKEWSRHQDALEKSGKAIAVLNNAPGPEHSRLTYNYSLKSCLLDKTPDYTFINYAHISHEVVVQRAIRRRKPFQENEKGYRDTLIWLSFLDYLGSIRQRIVGDIAFVSANKGDFGDAQKGGFLDELKEDIKQWCPQHQIALYNSLQEFIDQKIPRKENLLSFTEIRDSFIYNRESQIEQYLSAIINEMTPDQLATTASQWHRNALIQGYILSQHFEIDEGMEDFELDRYEELDGQRIYIACTLQLRRCSLRFSIPASYYLQHKTSIDKNYDDVDYSDEETVLSLYPRGYFDLRLIIGKSPNHLEEVEIVAMEFH